MQREEERSSLLATCAEHDRPDVGQKSREKHKE